jgi:hypothetical protein
MFPVFTVAMARDAVARQFDYDDAPDLIDDVAPAARPGRQTSPVRALARRLRGSLVQATWSPSR